MNKAQDYGLEVSEFELQSRYYAHFWLKTLGEGIELPYPPSDGLNRITAILL